MYQKTFTHVKIYLQSLSRSISILFIFIQLWEGNALSIIFSVSVLKTLDSLQANIFDPFAYLYHPSQFIKELAVI